MSRRGRRAALPTQGLTSHGLQPDRLTVRCFDHDGATVQDFDFSRMPVALDLQKGLAMTFAKRTAPGGAVTRMEGFRYSFRAVRLFADYLSGLAAPPTTMAELVDDHIDGFRDHRRATTTSAHREVSELKVVLRNSNELTAMMVAKVCQITLRKSNASKKASYSRDEFTQIARVARSDLRAAALSVKLT